MAWVPGALADRGFSARYATTERGQVTLAGNTLETCPGTGSSCTAARNGTTAIDNSAFVMGYVDVDSDASTFDSSRANLALPTGATVLWAGLYWAGDTSAGTFGSAAPTSGSRAQVRFATPTASYATVTAGVLDTDATETTRYQGFADVTALVKAAGNGTYALANVQSGTGSNRWAGWSLVVAYRDSSQPVRRLQVYDGFQALQSGATTSADIPLADLLTPASGTVSGRLALLSWEGDRGSTGESAALGTRALTDALNPADDAFNSTIGRDGATVTTRNPSYLNTLGVDADEFSINGALANGATSTTLHLTAAGDTYLPGAIALATDEGPPIARALPALNGSPRDGQTLSADRGTWDGTPTLTYAYQWRRCAPDGGSCTDIAGATNASYALTPADVGSTIRVVVTATNAAGSTTATSARTEAVAPTLPTNAVTPTVAGSARDGQTLTVDRGTWTGTPTIAYAYQWRRCAADGTNCAAIAGATATTYALTAADVGATIRAVVTASNAGGSSSAATPQTAAVVAAAPANTATPTIGGTVRDGQTLTADRGTWSGTPTIGYAYQWRRCAADGTNCADIAGATATTYALTADDVGATIRVAVTATNAAGIAVATSATVGPAAAAQPTSTSAPTIAGSARDGQTLTVDRGTWSGTPTIAYAYRWRRCAADGGACTDIAGATAATYALTAADVGATIRAVVTASNAAGSTSATTAATATVAPTAPVNSDAPSISGSARDGQTLTAAPGTWTGTPTIGYAYQWRRCAADGTGCADIAGAGAATYALTAADVGASLRVVATASNAAGSTAAASTQTATVTPVAPASSAAPAIAGTARDGETLTAGPGTWTGTPTITYAYQWRRCAADGTSCTDIAGATATSYALTPADVDAAVRVRVTATNEAGSVTATSSPSATVAPAPPVNSALPTVVGASRDGQTLTVDRGTWTGTPTITYAYRWRRCDPDGTACADIAAATSSSYALTPADVDAAIRVVVSASNAGGGAVATSTATAPVAATAPANGSAPTIAGTARDAQTLIADRGTWTGTPTIAYAYQWRRCDADGGGCADIAGATDATYGLTAADVGATIRVVVTATNAGGTATAAAEATATVAASAPASTSVPAIAGTARDGSTLTADRGTWAGTPPITYRYQWRRCAPDGDGCTDIAGAAASTYTTSGADVGRRLRVEVTATNAAGDATASSAATSTITAAAPANSTAPAIAGTARDGETLSVAGDGAWSGTQPIAFAYQWLRCDSGGGACAVVRGATASTYELNPADVGVTYRLRVTATNAGGTVSADSAATAVVAPAPPVNTIAPSIDGIAQQGRTVSAVPGAWSGTPTVAYAYQWLRCDPAGNGCVEIAGATATTYTPTVDDVGGRLRVRVTATNPGGTASASSAPAAVDPAAPVVTTAPSVSGTARDGSTVTAADGTWDGTPPFSYAHRWLRCDASGASCTPIIGATAASYTATPDDVGGRLRVVVTATNAAGSADATSAATAVVAAVTPANTALPSVSGTPRDGATLTADPGAWTGTPPLSYAYRWQRCNAAGGSCVTISGATQRTYTATGADVGKTLRSVVTASNAAGSSIAAISGPTAQAAAAAPASTAAPSISGTATDAATLTADKGAWSGTAPIAYAYRWQRCDAAGTGCSDIDGATGMTYALTHDDVGAIVRVRVMATNAAGSAAATSAPSAVVDPSPPINSGAPTVDGTARDGATLTAHAGDWTGTPPLDYAYQWRRCDADGAGCADVPGASASSYAVGPADVGHTLRLVVTATNAAGATAAASDATAPIDPAAPTSSAPPTVTGTPRDGATLTAAPGGWTGTPPLEYAYRWQRCDADATGCDEIAGATDADYDLTSDDVGHAIRVIVTATNAAGTANAASGATAAIDPAPPAATTAPAVAGVARDGATLTADRGTWDGTTPIAYSYQWQRCDADGAACVDIAGATRSTQRLTSTDAGRTLRVRVTATNAAGVVAAASGPTAVVAAVAPAITTAPSVAGNARDGGTLTADHGTWSGTTPIAYSYQWQRCDADGTSCDDVAGATSPSYALVAADVGRAVRVQVTADNVAGSAAAASAPSAAVDAAPPAATAAPTVAGEPVDGATLTADPGTWSGTPPLSFAHRWQRCTSDGECTDIDDESGPSYTLTGADVGRGVRVVVTATNAGGSATRASDPTSDVDPAAPSSTTAPGIAGEPVDGATLTADHGGWTGTAPLTFAYQWQRCDRDGTGCTAIDGATDAARTLTAADVDHPLRVVVTATNHGGSAARASTLTAAVAAAAPAITTAPAVAGSARDEATLTVDHGTWEGTPPLSYAYQWQRCAADGSACADVDGATAADYAVSGADVDHALRAIVTATNAGGSVSSASAPTDTVAAAVPAATTPPSVSGSARDGATLTADRGAWAGTDPIAYAYRWQRCATDGSDCVDIAGAAQPTYAATSDDVSHALRVAITASNAGGSTTERSSPTAAIAAVAPSNSEAPSLSGVARDGETLTAHEGAWSGSQPIDYAYQWQRCAADGTGCADVDGATTDTYGLVPDDVGHAVRVVVRANNAAASAAAVSAASAVVEALAPANRTPPIGAGTVRDGSTLTASRGTWAGTPPLTYAYQWLRCDRAGGGCVDIPDATASAYRLNGDDVDHALRVRVTATNAGGSATARSGASDRVTAAPAVLAGPTLSGAARDGSTLTADHGSWSGAQPIDYAYRWQRCDADGAGCADLPGATGTTYELAADDVGRTVRVVVTATNPDGAGEAASAASVRVQPAVAHGTPPPPAGTGQTPSGTDATPSTGSPPTTPGGAPADLAGLPGSLVSQRSCQQLVGDVGVHRAAVARLGTVIVRVRADSVVAAASPVRVTVTAPHGRRLLAALTVDGRRVRLSGRNPLAGALTPALLGAAGTHVLQFTLSTPGAKARFVRMRLRSAACATRFTARGRAVGSTSALALRIDSRTAIARVAFSLPSAVALRGGAAPRAAGRIRFVVAGGRSRAKRLTLPAGRRSGVLLAADGGPRVTFAAGAVVVSALPAGAGIVELTLTEPGHTATRALRLRARVTGAGGSTTLAVRTRGR